MLSNDEQNLSELDPIMEQIILSNGSIALEPRSTDYFTALASSIISQQISLKAAAKIFERFSETTKLLPENVREITVETQKQVGLSGQKVRYLKSLADNFINNETSFRQLDALSDKDIIAELTKVTGIGIWTAQMFLLFTLNRPDVFAPDDRGLQIALEKNYNLDSKVSRQEIEKFAEKWQPFRSTASLHLWRSLDKTNI